MITNSIQYLVFICNALLVFLVNQGMFDGWRRLKDATIILALTLTLKIVKCKWHSIRALDWY
jgi:hypothetical protein